MLYSLIYKLFNKEESNKKYVLTNKTIEFEGHTLHQIKAIKDFDLIEKGQLGGYIESYYNLSQSGDCWVHGNAKVYGNAIVCENAVVSNSIVKGNATVSEEAHIFAGSVITSFAKIRGWARVKNSRIGGDIDMRGNALIIDASVYSEKDYIIFKNWWSSGRFFTWTRSNNKWAVGCFHGTGERLIDKAYADSEEKGKQYERIVRYVEEILKDNN